MDIDPRVDLVRCSRDDAYFLLVCIGLSSSSGPGTVYDEDKQLIRRYLGTSLLGLTLVGCGAVVARGPCIVVHQSLTSLSRSVEHFEYDEHGRLWSSTKTTFRANSSETPESVSAVETAYYSADGLKRVDFSTDGLSATRSVTTYSYNERGKLTAVQQMGASGIQFSETFSYLPDGRISSKADGQTLSKYSYSPESLDYRVEIFDTYGLIVNVLYFNFQADGRLILFQEDGGNLADAEGRRSRPDGHIDRQVRTEYDDLARTVTQIRYEGQQVVERIHTALGPGGEVLRREVDLGGEGTVEWLWEYVYDSLGRKLHTWHRQKLSHNRVFEGTVEKYDYGCWNR